MGIKQKQQPSSASAVSPVGKITRLKDFFIAARLELSKVSWPTKQEVKATGLAVAGLVVIMSIFLGLVDLIFSWVVKLILSIGS